MTLVVRISSHDDGSRWFALHSPPISISGASMYHQFSYVTPPCMEEVPLQPGAVQQTGTELFKELIKDPRIRSQIHRILSAEDISPIYIRFEIANDAEMIHWEALHPVGDFPDRGFLALDDRWSIGRIVDPIDAAASKFKGFFEPPLKVFAVLTAAGIEASSEWEVLWNAFNSSSKEAEIEVKFKVLVCEEELFNHIRDAHKANSENSNIEVSYLESQESLFRQIKDFTPHILHFFCHATAASHLELSTRVDYELSSTNANRQASIIIEPRQFDKILRLQNNNIWLITLNCCSSAAATQETYSLTHCLVERGVPAGIGMRDLIESEDANLICRKFYSDVLQQIRDNIGRRSQKIEIEWVRSLCTTREALCNKYSGNQPLHKAAANSKEWLLPLLYTQKEAFELDLSRELGFSREEKSYWRNAQLQNFSNKLNSILPKELLNQLDEVIIAEDTDS